MKVIDLINDLFDYREFQTDKLPKKIRFNNKEFVFVGNSYYNENGINIMAYVDNTLDLRVEVEIIEEDKEIEEIKNHFVLGLDESLERVIEWQKENNKIYEDKINEIIRNHNKIMKNFDELKKGK